MDPPKPVTSANLPPFEKPQLSQDTDSGNLAGSAALEAVESGLRRDLTNPGDYPEGGLRAWSVIVGAWSGLVACFGLMNSIGAFQAYASSVPLAHYSEGDVGWIFSVYVFLAFFCGVLFGPVFDTHGPRWLILIGSILLVAGVFLLSISSGMAAYPCPNVKHAAHIWILSLCS